MGKDALVFGCVNADNFAAAVQFQFNDEVGAVAIIIFIIQIIIVFCVAVYIIVFVKIVRQIIFFAVYFDPRGRNTVQVAFHFTFGGSVVCFNFCYFALGAVEFQFDIKVFIIFEVTDEFGQGVVVAFQCDFHIFIQIISKVAAVYADGDFIFIQFAQFPFVGFCVDCYNFRNLFVFEGKLCFIIIFFVLIFQFVKVRRAAVEGNVDIVCILQQVISIGFAVIVSDFDFAAADLF